MSRLRLSLIALLAAPAAAWGQLDCGAAPPVLACNAWTSGSTVGGLNGVSSWPCSPFAFDGAESVHAFELAAPERVSVLLDDALEEGLDLFVLDACDPAACLAWGDRRVDLELDAGSYLVVVDGRGGVEADHAIGLACGEALEPALLETTAAPGDCFNEQKTGWLAAQQARVDVLFAIDLTFSMDQERAQLQAVMQDLIDRLQGLVPDVAFGLVSYRDYFTAGFGASPCNYNAGTYGNFGDWPYRLEQPITSDRMAMQATLDALPPAAGGNDGPEACARMMLEAAEDPAVSWRPDARRLLVSLSDALPHDCNLLACLGEVGTQFGPDLGRDGQPNTGDEFGVLEAVDALVAADVTLLHLDSSGGAVLDGRSFQETWDCWARRTGGEAVALEADGSVPSGLDLAELIARLARERLGGCSELRLRVEPGFEDWLLSASPAYLHATAGAAYDFTIDFCVPSDAPEGLHEFEVRLDCDGTTVATQLVRVDVRRPCLEPTLGPLDVRDAASCNHGLALTWPDANFPSGFGIYHVYRSELSCEDALSRPPIALGLDATNWLDVGTLADSRYFHVVEAEDSEPGSPCAATGPFFGGSVARSCAGPTLELADDALLPEGVWATLRADSSFDPPRLLWPDARELEPGERFHLLRARDRADAPFDHVGPPGGDERELEAADRSADLQYFDLRVANPCGSLSRDEFPPSFSP